MKVPPEELRLQFQPRLVEDAVLLAADRASPAERELFREERDVVYEIRKVDIREKSFRELDRRWFDRFRLGTALRELTREYGLTPEKLSSGLILRTSNAAEEGADLHDAPPENPKNLKPGRPVLVIRLRPATLAISQRLLPLLHRELIHVADMLDPAFAYSRSMPALDGGATHEKLVRNRYRVVWDTSVAGRLLARGVLPEGDREIRRRVFLGTFSMLSTDTGSEAFERFFSGARPSHVEILRFAVQPAVKKDAASGTCPLCDFPTCNLHANPDALSENTLSAIQRDRPQWSPAQGLCLQCADLYEAKASRHRRNDADPALPSFPGTTFHSR